MAPMLLLEFHHPDAHGNIRSVAVFQHFHFIPGGNQPNDHERWATSDCLRFLIDGEHEIEQDRNVPSRIRDGRYGIDIQINEDQWQEVSKIVADFRRSWDGNQ